MAVYPFYVKVNSSTRQTPTGVGCRKKNGYLDTDVYQRDKGEITTPYKIRQYTTTHISEDGKTEVTRLHTEVYFQGKCVHAHSTDY